MNSVDFNLIKEYNIDRYNFITNFQFCIVKMIKNNEVTKFSFKKFVSKVTFVPLNIKDDEAFVTLGKHVYGKRKDQYNFIGGGTSCSEKDWDYKSDYEKISIVASALFDEVYEEFGIMLNWEDFKRSLIDVKRAGSFLLFYVNIVNIDPKKFKNMYEDRLNIENLGGRYKEIEEIKDYSLNYIKSEYERLKDPETNKIQFYVNDEFIEVSRYVISMTKHIFDMIDKIKSCKDSYTTDIDKFKAIPLKNIYYKDN